MGALTADERRDLFQFYVTRDRVKLNITNIYLAQLLKLNYIDYIVTVNFDDLILKACTFCNFLPPVYDISNIKTITTTDIRKNSVIYLHGQYFGQWLLNNPDELNRVEDEVLRLFNAIKTRRTWIVLGYSGNDGIFSKIQSLGSFSNELFWVKKELDPISDKKVLDFINTPNINANKIEGYYADAFLLKLHAELSKLNNQLEAPEILHKPFSYIKSIIQSITEINDDDELNNNVKKMIDVCKERINKAITEYEGEDSIETLKQNIIEAILKNNFSDVIAKEFEDQINENQFFEAKKQLSWYFNDWGTTLSNLAKEQDSKEAYAESLNKFERAHELDPTNDNALNNCGTVLSILAKNENNKSLYKNCFERYKKASELNPNNEVVFNNWGKALYNFAILENDENSYNESIEKIKKSCELNPNNEFIFIDWGNILCGWGEYKNNVDLCEESILKYKVASSLNPKNEIIFNNWGNALSVLAKLKSDRLLYEESIKKYRKAYGLNPEQTDFLANLGRSLYNLAKLENEKSLYKESIKIYDLVIERDSKNSKVLNDLGTSLIGLSYFYSETEKEKILYEAESICEQAIALGEGAYNLSCIYALLGKKEMAFKYLKESLERNVVSKEYVKEDRDWDRYKEDEDFKALLNLCGCEII